MPTARLIHDAGQTNILTQIGDGLAATCYETTFWRSGLRYCSAPMRLPKFPHRDVIYGSFHCKSVWQSRFNLNVIFAHLKQQV
jgi:hypothetical protein